MPLHLLGISRSTALTTLAWSACDAAVWPAPTPIDWIIHEDLAAATIPALAASPTPMEHAQWLQRIHRKIDVLPVRYASIFPDDRSVRALLCQRRDGLAHELDRLQQTGEIGLRIELARGDFPSHEACGNESASSRYLAWRRARYARQDRLEHSERLAAKRYLLGLDGLYRQWRKLTSAAPGFLRLSFLVPRQWWGEFQARARELATEASTQRYTLLGPWPPYSFVSTE